MSQEVSISQVLESLGLQELLSGFMERGFDRVCDILCLDQEDLAMLIPDEKQQASFMTALQQGKSLLQYLNY